MTTAPADAQSGGFRLPWIAEADRQLQLVLAWQRLAFELRQLGKRLSLPVETVSESSRGLSAVWETALRCEWVPGITKIVNAIQENLPGDQYRFDNRPQTIQQAMAAFERIYCSKAEAAGPSVDDRPVPRRPSRGRPRQPSENRGRPRQPSEKPIEEILKDLFPLVMFTEGLSPKGGPRFKGEKLRPGLEESLRLTPGAFCPYEQGPLAWVWEAEAIALWRRMKAQLTGALTAAWEAQGLLGRAEEFRQAIGNRIGERTRLRTLFRNPYRMWQMHLRDLKGCEQALGAILEEAASLRRSQEGDVVRARLEDIDDLIGAMPDNWPPSLILRLEEQTGQPGLLTGLTNWLSSSSWKETACRLRPQKEAKQRVDLSQDVIGRLDLLVAVVEYADEPGKARERLQDRVSGFADGLLSRTGCQAQLIRRIEPRFQFATEKKTAPTVDGPVLVRTGIVVSVFEGPDAGDRTLRKAEFRVPPERSELVSALRGLAGQCLGEGTALDDLARRCERLAAELEPAADFAAWWRAVGDKLNKQQEIQKLLLLTLGITESDLAPAAHHLILAFATEGVVLESIPAPQEADVPAMMLLPALRERPGMSTLRGQLVDLKLLEGVASGPMLCTYVPPSRLEQRPLLRCLSGLQDFIQVTRSTTRQWEGWHAVQRWQLALAHVDDTDAAARQTQAGLELLSLCYQGCKRASQGKGPEGAYLEHVARSIRNCLVDDLGVKLCPPIDRELRVGPIEERIEEKCELHFEVVDREVSEPLLVREFGTEDNPGSLHVRVARKRATSLIPWASLPTRVAEGPLPPPLQQVRKCLFLAAIDAPDVGPRVSQQRKEFQTWVANADGERWLTDLSRLAMEDGSEPAKACWNALQDAGWIDCRNFVDAVLPETHLADAMMDDAPPASTAFVDRAKDLMADVRRDALGLVDAADRIRAELLDLLRGFTHVEDEGLLALLDGLFPVLVKIAERGYRLRVRPAEWTFSNPPRSAKDISSREIEESQAVFSSRVPEGGLVLEAFEFGGPGVQDEELRIARSAGTAPASHAELLNRLEALGKRSGLDTKGLCETLRQGWPAAKLRGPSVYRYEVRQYFLDQWELLGQALECSRIKRQELEEVNEVLEELLEENFAMQVFYPRRKSELEGDWKEYCDPVGSLRRGFEAGDELDVKRPGLWDPEHEGCIKAQVVLK